MPRGPRSPGTVISPPAGPQATRHSSPCPDGGARPRQSTVIFRCQPTARSLQSARFEPGPAAGPDPKLSSRHPPAGRRLSESPASTARAEATRPRRSAALSHRTRASRPTHSACTTHEARGRAGPGSGRPLHHPTGRLLPAFAFAVAVSPVDGPQRTCRCGVLTRIPVGAAAIAGPGRPHSAAELAGLVRTTRHGDEAAASSSYRFSRPL